MPLVRGSFDVTVTPEHRDEVAGETPLARLALVKRYHGPLDAEAHGHMLTAGAPASGWAGYVAIERVSGTLEGRRGAFALQHDGTMRGGATELRVRVVPGSGTGELTGIEGTLRILIDGRAHTYEFDYTLTAPA